MKLVSPSNKSDGGWWCPVPAPAKGEAPSFSQNCSHELFRREITAVNHFHSQHSDFRVWDMTHPKVRQIRKISFVPDAKNPRFVCGNGIHCPFGCDTLEELDAHVLTSGSGCRAYNMHPLVFGEVSLRCLRSGNTTFVPTQLHLKLQAQAPLHPVHAPNLIDAPGADEGGEMEVDGREIVAVPDT